MYRRLLPFILSAGTALSAVAQKPERHSYSAADTTIATTMRQVAGDIVRLDRAQDLDVVIVGELHALTSHDAAKLAFDDYLIDSMGVRTVAFEYPSSDKARYGRFYAEMDSVCRQSAATDGTPFAWIDDTQDWLADRVRYPYRLLELSQAFAKGAGFEPVDCERTGRRITQTDMTAEVEALLHSSPYFQDIAARYPRIGQPDRLEADTEDGMVFRNLLMAARIKKLLDENMGPVLSHNGRSHLHDVKLDKMPQLDEMLAEMGLRVATVDMGCSERGGVAIPENLYETGGPKDDIAGAIYVDMPWIKAKGFKKLDLRSSAKDLVRIKKLLPVD